MVWGVCRRLLDHHDAEDAFQATFLVLVRKASSVRGQAVANWLYGVARQTAVRLRATAAKRGRRETQVVNMPEPTVPEVRDAELQVAVDEELSRLPDHYRGVAVLCDLEGMTRKEAARQLGIPEGSVASRLARARALLAKRLARRGVVFSSGSVAALLSAESAFSSAPPSLVASTIQAAGLLAAGQAAGTVSGKVAALTDGVVKAMFVTKIKSVLAVVLVAGLALGGTGLGVGLATNPAVAQAETPRPPAEPKGGVKPSEAVAERLVGTWAVKFENGVNEWCRVNKDRTAKVAEPQRRSPGKVEVRDGAVLVVYDDDRLERWTPAGDGAAVEHWFPASNYPKRKPVKGIAERTTEKPADLPDQAKKPKWRMDLKGHVGPVMSLAYSPDGQTLASGGYDRFIRLWDLKTGKESATLKGHQDVVNSVAYSPDGKTLASGSADKSIKVWDVTMGKEKGTLEGHLKGVTSVAYSPDGKTLASGSGDHTIKLWDVETGKETATLKGHNNVVRSVAYSPDGKTLATGSADQTIKLWDVKTAKELATIKIPGGMCHVVFSPDGETLAAGGGNTIGTWQAGERNALRRWDVKTGKELATLDSMWDTFSVAYNPDGKTLALGGNTDVLVLDAATGKELFHLDGKQMALYALAYSLDGKSLASAGKDQTIKVWDVKPVE
jgi:RNA polymerase sigma factor (sigma-70 family)